MRHIKQINTNPYTVVIANEPLENHISIVKNPLLFEIVDSEIPSDAQYLNYQTNVPSEVQLWRVRTVLRLMQLETAIATALDALDEPTKTGAKTIWEFGTTIERNSQTVLFLQAVLQMADEQVDEIFIQAEAIQI
tara:strand:+ start:532 stop:936 length:405 start_codon:yes stop_codon:yes gene_type:complete